MNTEVNPARLSLPDPGASDARQPGTPACVVLLLLLMAALYLPGVTSLPLMDPEESRCALVVQEMRQNGHWLLPYLDGQPYDNKPAPFFWLAWLGTAATGSMELGGRAVAIAGAIGAVLIAFAWGRRLGGNLAGLLAGVILASSAEFLFLARYYRMDMPFAACGWAALWWFWRYEHTPGARWRQWVGFYGFCGLATLMKGPAGLALGWMVVAPYLAIVDRRRLWGLLHPAGLLTYLLIAAPWYVAMSLADPAFVHQFFVGENLQRFADDSRGHVMPFYFYVPVAVAGMAPWVVFAPAGLMRTWPGRKLRENAHAVLLLLAAIVPFVFFSLAHTKLVNYILPIFPPLAVLTALPLARWAQSTDPDRLYKAGAWIFWALLALLFVAVGIALHVLVGVTWLFLAGAAVGALILIRAAHALIRQRRLAFLLHSTAALAAGVAILFMLVGPALYGRMSAKPLGRMIASEPGPVCYWGQELHSLVAYSGRTAVGKVHGDTAEDMEKALQMLPTRPAFCVVSGNSRLQMLQNALPGQVRVLARRDKQFLVELLAPPTTAPTTVPTTAGATSAPTGPD